MFSALRFRIFIGTHIIFLRMSSPRRLSFSFPLPLLFSFPLFPHFSFVPFFFSYFPLFSPFSQFVSFPQFSLPFPKSAAPVLPYFLLPCVCVWGGCVGVCVCVFGRKGGVGCMSLITCNLSPSPWV